jgi:hypothetical protein
MGEEDSQAGPVSPSILPKLDPDLMTYVGKGIPEETLQRTRKHQEAAQQDVGMPESLQRTRKHHEAGHQEKK